MLFSIAKIALTAGSTLGLVALAATNASAFSFTTNYSPDPVTDSKGDIFLESVVINGTTIAFSNLALVSEAKIVNNKQIPVGSTSSTAGGASADVGDQATGGVKLEQLVPGDPASEAAIVQNLSSNNLNHIIDTEEYGFFTIDLTFDKGFNKLLFWERGLNSLLGVQIGDKKYEIQPEQFSANLTGYSIDTTEIKQEQPVGSFGLDLLKDFNVNGKYTGPVTLYAKSSFNGPDFKVVGAAVPEPATVLGLTAVAGAFVASRRRKAEA